MARLLISPVKIQIATSVLEYPGDFGDRVSFIRQYKASNSLGSATLNMKHQLLEDEKQTMLAELSLIKHLKSLNTSLNVYLEQGDCDDCIFRLAVTSRDTGKLRLIVVDSNQVGTFTAQMKNDLSEHSSIFVSTQGGEHGYRFSLREKLLDLISPRRTVRFSLVQDSSKF